MCTHFIGIISRICSTYNVSDKRDSVNCPPTQFTRLKQRAYCAGFTSMRNKIAAIRDSVIKIYTCRKISSDRLFQGEMIGHSNKNTSNTNR